MSLYIQDRFFAAWTLEHCVRALRLDSHPQRLHVALPPVSWCVSRVHNTGVERTGVAIGAVLKRHLQLLIVCSSGGFLTEHIIRLRLHVPFIKLCPHVKQQTWEFMRAAIAASTELGSTLTACPKNAGGQSCEHNFCQLPFPLMTECWPLCSIVLQPLNRKKGHACGWHVGGSAAYLIEKDAEVVPVISCEVRMAHFRKASVCRFYFLRTGIIVHLYNHRSRANWS
jgi:hypothetical protein